MIVHAKIDFHAGVCLEARWKNDPHKEIDHKCRGIEWNRLIEWT